MTTDNVIHQALNAAGRFKWIRTGLAKSSILEFECSMPLFSAWSLIFISERVIQSPDNVLD